jgi:hypothetical protein
VQFNYLPEGIAVVEYPPNFDRLPGADLVVAGVADVENSRVSVEACLVAMASLHLARAGIEVDDSTTLIPNAERTLYELLSTDGSGKNPYPRYNSLKRRIVSFARALSQLRRVNKLAAD